jgi:non-heme chloroperoxidase
MIKILLLLLLFSFPVLASEPVSLDVRSADGTRLAAQVQGADNGREIVLIHGLAQSHLAWNKQIKSEMALKYKILTYDLRGHGASAKPLAENMYSEGKRWGEDLQSVIKAAGFKKPILVGWSLGGAVILNYLKLYGDKAIAGIVFVDAVVGFKKDLFGRENQALWQETLNPSLDKRVNGIINVVKACFEIQPAPEEFATMLVYNGMIPKEVIAGSRKISIDDSELTLRNIKVPSLFIQGEKDKLVEKQMAIYAKSLTPQLKTIFYPNSGHAPFFEEPQRFNSDVSSFITTIR